MKRKRCGVKGCRRQQQEGMDVCREHFRAPVPIIYPVDEVLKMEPLERLNVGKVEAELANLAQAIRIHDLETNQLAREHADAMQARAAHRAQLISAFSVKKKEQESTIQEVAQKYGLDATKMAYDPDTGILRDLTKETTE
ncbi:MAG: hypothetical protein MUC88_00075 [Planctomycetes bacterium]|jgi:hypothetical protein|nr:hypothetical protein [Planctomycetota bacterium]